MVFPVVLGSGKRLFAEGNTSNHLRLVDVQQASEVAILTLQSK